ncbi:hypothetical protein NUSPORA_01813 [Nucleospora cyclopteri]
MERGQETETYYICKVHWYSFILYNLFMFLLGKYCDKGSVKLNSEQHYKFVEVIITNFGIFILYEYSLFKRDVIMFRFTCYYAWIIRLTIILSVIHYLWSNVYFSYITKMCFVFSLILVYVFGILVNIRHQKILWPLSIQTYSQFNSDTTMIDALMIRQNLNVAKNVLFIINIIHIFSFTQDSYPINNKLFGRIIRYMKLKIELSTFVNIIYIFAFILYVINMILMNIRLEDENRLQRIVIMSILIISILSKATTVIYIDDIKQLLKWDSLFLIGIALNIHTLYIVYKDYKNIGKGLKTAFKRKKNNYKI